ncbi:hypothetical protein PFISCL1PPCAC_22249, partial [Pristionchus fissidentatus]
WVGSEHFFCIESIEICALAIELCCEFIVVGIRERVEHTMVGVRGLDNTSLSRPVSFMYCHRDGLFRRCLLSSYVVWFTSLPPQIARILSA